MTQSGMVLVFYFHTAYKAKIHWFQKVLDAEFKTLYESIFQARANLDLNVLPAAGGPNEVDDGSRERH